MPKIFLPLEVDFDFDEKVAALARWSRPGEARALRDLLVGMWRYCKLNTTDGHVPLDIVGKLVYPDAPKVGERDADRLASVGLCERTATGYYFPKYLKRNKSRAQIEEKSRKTAAAGAAGGKASGQVRRSEADAKHNASTTSNTENRVQKSEDTPVIASKGERPETLHAVSASKPSPTCIKHPNGNPRNEACGGCAKIREREEAEDARIADHARRAADTLRRNCSRCHGSSLIEDENGKPVGKCTDHVAASSVGAV